MCKFNPKNDSRRIDPCLKDYLKFLQEMGIITRGSCCGHNKYPRTIVIERTNVLGEVKYYELLSGIEIPRKKRFYVKDRQGVYYIPETIPKLFN